MKKLFTLGSILLLGAVNVFAQNDFVEEDMTHYIVNAGFDEDLTFHADGSYKDGTALNKETESLGGRSWSYVNPDGSCFAHAKTADEGNGSWKQKDSRTWATNGYISQIKGWECTRTDYPKCEWVYFGVLPYDMEPQAIPIADDGDAYQNVPEKPDFADTEENKGALFLRAGWQGECTYKQVVKLPCAVYRLEYWTINANASSSASATDLTNITCRKDKFVDETGSSLTAKEWTKHEFEFTPTSEFTIEFGYRASNAGSNKVPHIFIDGIKLYKIGEAERGDLLLEDFNDVCDSLYERFNIEGITENLVGEIYDAIAEAENYDSDDELEANIKTLKEFLVKVDETLVTINKFNSMVNKIERYLSQDVKYPGEKDLNDAYKSIMAEYDEATINDYATLLERLDAALNSYLFSQVATDENPADYTFFIKHPNFTTESNEPTYDADGLATYPNGDIYTDGSTPTLADGATSEGWYKGSNTGGDQRINYKNGRICWNLWANSASTNVNDRSINQDITNLPAGYYSFAADFITQPEWPHEAHAFVKNSHSDISSPVLTTGTMTTEAPWGAWTTLKTDKILVADGKLTVGGRSIFPYADQTGWFCMTNVKLYYHGAFTAEDYKVVFDKAVAEAQAMCDTMFFAGDKAVFAAAINKYKVASTIEEMTISLDSIRAAKDIASASISKWEGVKTGVWTNLKDSIAANVYTTEANQIVQKVVDIMTSLVNAEDATYTTMDGLTAVLRKYRDSYIPNLIEAQSLTYTVQMATDVLNACITGQVAELTSIVSMPSEAVMNAYIDNLNAAITEAKRIEVSGSIKVEAGADMTGLIVNATIDDTYATGWNVNKVVGDGNGAKSGQQFDGDTNGFYIDSNSNEGNLLLTVSQTLTNIPNGRYEIKAMTRTTGEGSYIYGIADNDSANIRIKHINKNEPFNYTQNIDPTYSSAVVEGDSIFTGSNTFGPIWFESAKWVNTNLGLSIKKDPDTGAGLFDYIEEYKMNNEGNINDETMYHLNVAAANNGNGRGWAYSKIEIEVKDHLLTLGVTTDSVFTKAYKDIDGADCVPFNGTWFSADNFTLTLLTPGDNTGWDPTATGIESVVTPENVAVRVENGAIIANGEIYSISGSRVANGTKVPAGVYIVRQGKVAKKVLVK